CGEDCHRQAVRLDPFLVEISFDLLERAADRVEGFVPGAAAFDIDDCLGGESRVLAEDFAGRRRRVLGPGLRRRGRPAWCLPERRGDNPHRQDGGHPTGPKTCKRHPVLLIDRLLARLVISRPNFLPPCFTAPRRLRLAQISAAARTGLDLNEARWLLI